jgi:hypothetical protein
MLTSPGEISGFLEAEGARRVLSCRFLSFSVVFCRVLSCPACPVVSCRVLLSCRDVCVAASVAQLTVLSAACVCVCVQLLASRL